ncbi:MAG: chromosomal replication initiator protein DnaA [Pseudobdellovibrionaceae bacterium]|nr:chromosomal replication initiator protein DnaA [Bdellovibrionales bacterium]USN49021.1 MAG: chromosomal replication initiator protein DnaA [Pseudobdellovibrionaceae bacterium]
MNNKPLQYWFEPTSILELKSNNDSLVFRLGVPTELHKYWISQNLLALISSEVSALVKQPFQIDLVVTGDDTALPQQESEEPEQLSLEPSNEASRQMLGCPTNSSAQRDALNIDYTFSTFVVGRNNEFAHAACFNIAENPGADSYNPLFICGPTGMGKTHLLNAVGNHVKQKFPDLTICYCSAERFLNECISSIRRGEMHKFRLRYREKCHVLLMDDIQILNRGEAVQEEFFHTLNDFFEKGQQVVVASDRMPKDIVGLEDRIRTRLEWGLIADIQMPDIETRVAILKYKAERKGINIPPDVVSYIARISKRSIRELEGNLNKVKMFSELQGLNINMDLAKRVLATHDDTNTITVDEIQKITAEHFKVRVPDLKARSRTKPIVTARQMAMYMIKKYLDKSLVDIGRAFGGKDHTTVINALRRIEDQLAANSDLKRDFNDIEARIHNITGV